MTKKQRRLLRFLVFGAAFNFALVIIFVVLSVVGVPAVPASVVTYIVGVALAFVGQKTWTFESKTAWVPAVAGFILLYAVGAIVVAGMQLVLHEWLGFRSIAVQIVAIVLVGVFNFLALDLLVFRADSSNGNPGQERRSSRIRGAI